MGAEREDKVKNDVSLLSYPGAGVGNSNTLGQKVMDEEGQENLGKD